MNAEYDDPPRWVLVVPEWITLTNEKHVGPFRTEDEAEEFATDRSMNGYTVFDLLAPDEYDAQVPA